jgi:hypothetical protein
MTVLDWKSRPPEADMDPPLEGGRGGGHAYLSNVLEHSSAVWAGADATQHAQGQSPYFAIMATVAMKAAPTKHCTIMDKMFRITGRRSVMSMC